METLKAYAVLENPGHSSSSSEYDLLLGYLNITTDLSATGEKGKRLWKYRPPLFRSTIERQEIEDRKMFFAAKPNNELNGGEAFFSALSPKKEGFMLHCPAQHSSPPSVIPSRCLANRSFTGESETRDTWTTAWTDNTVHKAERFGWKHPSRRYFPLNGTHCPWSVGFSF
ncbi:hypothetical protein F7725_019225 [Dissostichus mawsoni]|uniref:Uncharacterized protein n=1 Tax=Dissostichus mawsoni TaxID=36200 RepID=A0A7J5YJ30_DISMA|nr:hypothetical protein F7725_019225 [Dissostichus mawsoni]